jgi:hypothetical protein
MNRGGRLCVRTWEWASAKWHMREYANELENCGMKIEMCPLDWTDTFPPLRVLIARKPA